MLNNIIMKNIFRFLIIIAVVFVSCEDDNPKYEVPNVIVGTWKVTDIGTRNSSGAIIYVTNTNSSCPDDTFVFSENNTFEANDFSLVNTECENNFRSGMFVVEIRTLTLSYQITVNNELQDVTKAYTLINLYENEALLAYTDDMGIIRYLKIQRV